MEVRNHCDSMYAELTFIKGKIDNIIRVIEKMPCETKGKLMPKLHELYALMDYLNERIEQLLEDCPVNWAATKEEIEVQKG